MILNLTLGSLALLSLALTLWQWLVARRFPLHERLAKSAVPPSSLAPHPPITLLKPLKGCDAATEACLRSWLVQQYGAPVQVLFGVAAADDPVCDVVRKLIQEFPAADSELVVCGPPRGANAKVSQLAELERRARHDLVIISDADVQVPDDLLANIVPHYAGVFPAAPEGAGAGAKGCGLVCCFYRLANPTTLAMHWEATAINADFWSQVLQSRSLKPIDFALGAVMATGRQQLREIGGFAGLIDCLADDYQLGNRIARRGYSIVLSPVVVECWTAAMGWVDVWKHQLRWARTIRVCQPLPYFFSILNNATLWPLVWLATQSVVSVALCAGFCWLVRILTALSLQRRLNQDPNPGGRASPRVQSSDQQRARVDARPSGASAVWRYAWFVPFKDLLQTAIWLLAFMGSRIEWRGQRLRLRPDGTLVRG